jgi:predicted secreted protein
MSLFIPNLYCGDVSTFVNLGFSGDSKYFMFAQYGVRQTNSGSFCDLFFVDVTKNVFAAHGQKTLSYDTKVEPGTFGIGSLINIVEENIALTTKYEIDHLRTGRILYHLLDGEKSKDNLSFRDFISGDSYTVTLVQSAAGEGKNVRSAFNISFTIKKSSGSAKTYTVGHPGYQRSGVRSYKIRQIMLSPDNRSLIFVIEKEEAVTEGVNIRYMIEAIDIGS